MIKRLKGQTTDQEMIFSIHVSSTLKTRKELSEIMSKSDAGS